MRDIAVCFKQVWKSYPSYYHVTGGIKSFLFNMTAAVRDLHQRRTAIEDMSFNIFKGENFGFVGRNGAGKSTTLGLIAGVLSPERGTVTVNGRISPLLQLGAGFHPELTGRENIMLNGVLMGLTKAEVASQLENIIEFSELEAFINQPVRTYSSGMYSKLGFAVVANLKPEILLLDEILSVGDICFAKKCEAKFEEFRSNPEVTVVLVSHGLDSVKRMCDRAAWVEDKTIKMIGPAAEVVQAYTEANTTKVTVSAGGLISFPPHVWAGRAVVDCTQGPARLNLHTSWDSPSTCMRLALYAASLAEPIQEWECPPGMVTLSIENDVWQLAPGNTEEDKPAPPFPPLLPKQGPWNPSEPLRLRLVGGDDKGRQSPPTWLAVFATQEASVAWQKCRGDVFRAYSAAPSTSAPLWPVGKTLRVVARNLVTRDAVGNFALGVAGLATSTGLPTRLYAYVTCPELAGIVAPIGDLKTEAQPGDTVFYNWSIEDEFLPQVASITCHKVLYYHNVTPGKWFREYNTDFANLLDRSHEQFAFFKLFDAALANSFFSLQDITAHLSEECSTAVCPPCVDPMRLTRLAPEQVPLPAAKKLYLWVGRMAPHKQPEKALTMFSEIAKTEDAILAMVGGGRTDFPAYASKIQREIDSMPKEVQDRVVFLSNLPDEKLAWLYRQADVLLCTSGHEGFCLPVLEARLFGLKVIALPQEAVRETLELSLESCDRTPDLLATL